MDEVSKLYLSKDFDKASNVYIFLKEVNGYTIFKEYDTNLDEFNIIAVDDCDKNKEFYSFERFLKEATFFGSSGYFKGMFEVEKYTYESFVLLYKNYYHELLYDTISDKLLLGPSCYEKDDFVSSDYKKKAPLEALENLAKIRNREYK